MSYHDDTIAAISTGSGSAGIGIIRISGEKAVETASALFRSIRGIDLNDAEPGRMYYGHIINPEDGKLVDEVLLLKMKKPHSYTGEDVVEINCHGGIVPTRKILRLVLEQGVRHAEPGEFTKRAFLNGRIDLTQAESVMDVISAKSEKALEISVEQLSGSLKDRIHRIDQIFIDLLVLIESNLDYPEYEIEEVTSEKIEEGLKRVKREVNTLLDYAKNGYLMREGVKTAIIGKPNVGKSSLLNLLLGEDRAIVTNIPGTTRDVIQEAVMVDDIPFVITDTAGIRDTEDMVEKIGVEKSRKAAEEADLVLFMKEAGKELDGEEVKLMESIDPRKSIFIANKADRMEENVPHETYGKNWIELSVLKESGIEKLKQSMVDAVSEGSVEGSDNAVLLNDRQENLLREVLKHVGEAEGALEAGMPEEIYAIDITRAEEKLREITGETLGEDVIDTIFERFCIGK